MDKIIAVNDYLYFDDKRCHFYLTNEASEIIYREKGVICSYSGANEWCHHFFCELLDLYSGGSIYNYSLGSYRHEEMIRELCKEGHADEVVGWFVRHVDDAWFQAASKAFVAVFEGLPNIYAERNK